MGPKGAQIAAWKRPATRPNHESNPDSDTAARGIWDQIRLLQALRGPPLPPQKGYFGPKLAHFGAPGDQEEVQYQAP